MKLQITCMVSIATWATYAIPRDNSHYVDGDSRYIWIPDGEGRKKDLREPLVETTLKTRSGSNNQYWLFTRSNPTTAHIIVSGCSTSIKSSNYLGSRPLKVIVHGWNNNGSSPMNPIITSAFLAVLDCNVIVVDWSELANSKYKTASAGVPSVGQFLGNFLIWLIDTAGGDWNNVHLVGFSLGAHIVGIAGRQTGGRPARITGLDPAGPYWTDNPNTLNSDAGQYVEGIHTDGNRFGLFNPVGHVDFYPNGGTNPQPGCWVSTCSHGRASQLFASTVQYDHLIGRRCQNIGEAELNICSGPTLNMGNSIISKRGYGLYALNTSGAWPF